MYPDGIHEALAGALLVGSTARATWTGAPNDALRGAVALEPYGEPRRRLRPGPLAAVFALTVSTERREPVRVDSLAA